MGKWILQEGSWNHRLCCNLLISWSKTDSRYFLNHVENAVWLKDLDHLLGVCCILWFMLGNCTFNNSYVNTVITCSFYYEFVLAIFNPLFILGNWLSVNVKGFFPSFQYNAMPPCRVGVHYLHDANIMKDRPGVCSASKSRCYMVHDIGH